LILGSHDLPAFVLAGVALNLFPGPDTVFIVSQSVARGRVAGILAVLGVSTGILVHISAAALGLSALLASSALGFAMVKWAGVCYLIYLGLRLVLEKDDASPDGNGTRSMASESVSAYRQGLITNVLNPKVAVFFLAFLPQFVDTGYSVKWLPFVILGGIFISTGLVWGLVLASGAARVSASLRAMPTGAQRLRKGLGAVFVGLGAYLALREARA